MKIAYLSSYQPRKCGLATFNDNLIKAIDPHVSFAHHDSFVVAINDSDDRHQYQYDKRVRYVIRQEQIADYQDAADLINESGADICCIQHEFGIFGGDSGIYLLNFVRSLRIPFVVIFHTVLESPDAVKSMIIKTLAQKAERIVVMSKKAIQLLKDVYQIVPDKMQVIPHGVPDFATENRDVLKEKLGLQQRTVLLTFGLISPNKGLETVINALPDLCRVHPDILYIVLGKTHPNVERTHGLEYVARLQQLAVQLGVADHLLFVSDFVSEKELHDYLTACDIYITPYLHREQITSGTLSYAIGAGAAVVSTPYWHAEELLDGGRGRFFDFNDHQALFIRIHELLSEPGQLQTLKTSAYNYGLSLRWPVIGKAYAELFRVCIGKFCRNFTSRQKTGAIEIPAFNAKHLIRLTDDTGILQHSRYGIPNRKEGYCLDDNARALIAIMMAGKEMNAQEVSYLTAVYLAYIQYMQRPDGNFHNFLSYSRQYLDEVGSEDAFGRTVWALGQLLFQKDANPSFKALGYELFNNAAPHFDKLVHLRGIANTLIGISYYCMTYPQDVEMIKQARHLAGRLKEAYCRASTGSWQWFEEKLTYDNGILPLALLHAYEVDADEETKQIALATLAFLSHKTTTNGYLTPIGNQGWYSNGGEKPLYDQQAIDAMAMVLANAKAFELTAQPNYEDDMVTAFNWFLGANSIGVPLYDPQTGGCRDGLSAAGANLNQGAESTLAYLISHAAVSAALKGEKRTGLSLQNPMIKLDDGESVSHLNPTVLKGVRFTG